MTPDVSSSSPRNHSAKLYRWLFLSLRYSIPYLTIIVAMMGYLIYEERSRSLEELSDNQRAGVSLGSFTIRKHFNRSMGDLALLSESNELHDLLTYGNTQSRAELEREFISFSRGTGLYDQIRFIDMTGQEVVRVNYNGGSPRAVKSAELQNKADRYYFSDSIKLGPGEIYFSPLDLNIEHGKVEEPHKPMLRLAMPIFHKGEKRGILVLNILGRHMLDDFYASTSNIRSGAMLLNNEGYWLFSPVKEDEWGFMFERKASLAARNPALWERMSRNESGQMRDSGGLWTWETVRPFDGASKVAEHPERRDPYSWKVASYVSHSEFDAAVSPQFSTQLVAGVVLCLLALVWSGLHAGSRLREEEKVEHIRQSEHKLRDLFDSMAEGFALHEIIIDESGTPVDYRFLEVNPAFEKLTGLKADDVIGRTLHEVLPNSEPVWVQRYGKVALSGKPDRFSEYSRETGKAFDISAYSPAHGQFACVFTDVTVNRHLEEQLRQSQKMESIGTLAGGVAHDFNNILTVIMGAAAMMQMKLEHDPELGPFVRQISSSAERAAKLTHSLLAFSRKQTIRPAKVEVNDIVSTMKEFLGRIIGEDITLTTLFSPEKLPVLADRGQIEQVLMNLAVNARDAMPNGGTITIETSIAQSRDHTIELDGCRPGEYALVSVTDSGVGMDATVRSRIFEPFFTTKEIGYGTGLGLSMAYGIIRQHDGTITVYSEPGEGSVFRLYLPLHGSRGDAENEQRPRTSLPGGAETILLVEDDPEVRSSNSAILECVGYNVLSACDGEEAIALYGQFGESISLVVLDVIMPGMNGKQIRDFLREIDPQVRTLFISGYTADILNRKGVLAEDINFLPKPLEPHLFLSKVRELIDG